MVSVFAACAFLLVVLGCSPTISAEKTLLVRRSRRSLMDLNDMVGVMTGRSGTDFINYGNWCGVGGKGKPVDDIDRCCAIHDICYDVALMNGCRFENENIVYTTKYEWRLTFNGVQCSSNKNGCKTAVCECDAKLVTCLRNHIRTYNKAHQRKLNLEELVEQIQQITQ